MTNSVGSVSIDLEANIAKFTSDLGRAARVAEQQAESMRKSLESVVAVLGGAVSVAGITAWVKSAINAQDEISKLSQKVGVSTELLSGWELAAKQAGVESESFQSGLIKLAQAAGMAADGSIQQVNAFKSIGISATDANGKMKPVGTLLEQIADKFSKTSDSTAKTVEATRLFGRAGADLIPLLNAGSAGLAEYTKMADDFGLTVGGKAAKASEDFNDSLEQLSFVGKGVANQLASALSPALADLTQKATAFFRSGSWKSVLNDISSGAQTVAQNIDKIVDAVKTLGEIVATVYATKIIRAGTEWIANLAAQSAAIAANGVAITNWGAATTASFANAKKNIGLVGIALNVIGSAIVGWQIGKYLSDQFLQVRLAAVALVDGTMTAWENIKYGAQVAWAAVVYVAKASIDSVLNYFAKQISAMGQTMGKLPDWLGGAKIQAAYQSIASAIKPATDATDDFNAKVDQLTDAHNSALKAIHATTDSMADYEIAQEAAKKAATDHASAETGLGNTMGFVSAKTQQAQAALDAYTKAMDAARGKLADVVNGYAGKIETPDVQAWNEYAAAVQKAAEAAGAQIAASQAALKKGAISPAQEARDEASAQQQLATGLGQLSDAYSINAAAAQRRMNVGQQMALQLQQEGQAYLMSDRDATIYRAGLQVENNLRQSGIKYSQDFIDAQKQMAENAAAANYDLQKYAEQQNQIAQEYAGFWENAASSMSKAFGDFITGQTKSFKDFGQSLKSIAQQFVSDIVSQFLRLRVLGPILSGAMGTVAGWLGITGDLSGSSLSMAANYYGNGGTVGSTANAVGGATGATGGTNSYASFLQNGVQGYKAYQWAMNGGILGSYGTGAGNIASVGVGANGQAVAFNPFAGSAGYSPAGGVGWGGVPYASYAGGILGALYGSKQGGGGISTGLSTVGYGALGAGIAGTAAGVAGGASVGTAAGSAFGAAAASTSWIPIVGWIMAGLAALDHFSGGKVFGTGWKPAQSNVSLGVSPEGSTASADELLWKYKGQTGLSLGGFLTGGLSQLSWWGDKKTKTQQLDVTPEMLQAAQQLYDSMEKVLVSGATQLGIKVPDMITASLTAQTTYDKKGKAQGTDYLVQYLGQTWKEATAEAAQERLGADALLSVVAASAGDVANQIAKQWQDSADDLADGVNTLMEAQQDIVRGNSLVALGSTATLPQIIAFVQSLQASGEKLADTYTRLMQASQAYEQFVGQFTPTSTTFGASLEAIATQMQANIDQANQLAQAAGMQGAAESDLANIHQQAAQQAAAAITQLSASAQDLAAQLYDVTNGSLSAVQAQLSKMQSSVQSATQLAIGDDSPYSDQQKLQIALSGLRSGLTSADDVLALGRKLYASSADYTGLFNKVQEIMGVSSSGAGSLGDQIGQYNNLYSQQQQLQSQSDASARYTNAQTLAQYVAEISTTNGVSYGDVASGLGFNLSDLAKDLGVSNITGYLDQLKLQDIPGTMTSDSASIVDAIQKLGRDLIQTITGAPLTSATGVTGSTATATAEQTALLKSIDQRLAAIEESSGTTAATNKTMVNQGASQKLNQLTLTGRGMLA